MKKLILTISIICFGLISQAQTYDSVPPYMRSKEIPSFNVLQTDSTWFRNQDIPKGNATVIVYFNPDCGHCQQTAKHIAAEMPHFSDVTFLWTTYISPLDEVAGFMKDFGLSQYPNVHYGKDPQYYIPSYFRVEYTPFIALFDKKGKLVQAWPKDFTVSALQAALKTTE